MLTTPQYYDQFNRIFERNPQLSDIKPSAWAEKRIVIPDYGKLSFDDTPYCREILDCMAPDNPMRRGAVMKGSQIRFSSNVIMPALGYIIEEDPNNTILMVGDSDLIKAAGEKLDLMIHLAGLKDYLSPAVKRKRATKTGDTDARKNFSGKYIEIGTNSDPKAIAQKDLLRIFLDDFDAMDGNSKTAGSFLNLIEMRAASSLNNYKLLMISTPLLKGHSNIEKAYLRGDQRRYFIHCECCHEPIILKWTVQEGELINSLTGQKALCAGGIDYQRNNHDQVDRSTVGYICYLCGEKFTDRNKRSMLLDGFWERTSTSIAEDYFSWHISALYAPVRAFDWRKYAEIHAAATPTGQPTHKDELQTLVNTCWGETWEEENETNKATDIMRNQRRYAVGTVPEAQSMEDGNGRIMLITCAADMNGKVEDARLDWEVVAWAENGARYSIAHGSIGTFVKGVKEEDDNPDRVRWNYNFDVPGSVWPEFEKVLDTAWMSDKGNPLRVVQAVLDSRHFTINHAYPFLDRTQHNVLGVMGEGEDSYERHLKDVQPFRESKNKPDKVFILKVGLLKDAVAEHMKLRWMGPGQPQPDNFMNYPEPSGGLYTLNGFFSHYESEHRHLVSNSTGTNVVYRWEKKDSTVQNQNHFWDCYCEETEVLTSEGWKFFKDITYDDELATVNLETDQLEYHWPQAIIKNDYEGKMIHIDGRRVNALVTPNHRMVVYRKRHSKASKSGRMSNNPEVVLAKDLRATDTIKLSCSWTAAGDEYYTVPEMRDSYGRLVADAKQIPADIWAAFLGLYISEGNKSRTYSEQRGSWAHRVTIYQNVGEKFDKIKQIFDALPFHYRIHYRTDKRAEFVITQKQLYDQIEGLGANYYSKRSGDWIKRQSSDVIAVFLDHAMLGDGYTNPDGGHRKYYTTSKQLADDIQELIIKTGAQGNIYHVQPPKCKLSGTADSQLQYHVSENKSDRGGLRLADNTPVFSEVDYSGKVYCATVPTGTLICRRRGKSFVAGNCAVYNLAAREIFVHLLGKEIKKANPELRSRPFTWKDFVKMVKGE